MTELVHRQNGSASVVTGELVVPDALTVTASEVAARQRSPETRRTYAAVYRSFCAFLGPEATADDLTPAMVRAYRDALEHAGRTPATIAKHLSAVRGLAAAVGAHRDVRTVRSAGVARGEPRALSHDDFARLLRMPDRRTRHGKRDLALLQLLGSVGLRRSEAAKLLISDVDERRRAGDPRLRQAIKASTAWWVVVRYAKRGRSRAVPLDEDALEAIVDWVKSRPTAPTEHLLLSLPRTGQPGPLSTRDVARIVARHAAAADLPDDRRSPHVLRHTFCTHLADAGADTAVIRELAGHADIRTTTVYTAVNPARLEQAVAERHIEAPPAQKSCRCRRAPARRPACAPAAGVSGRRLGGQARSVLPPSAALPLSGGSRSYGWSEAKVTMHCAPVSVSCAATAPRSTRCVCPATTSTQTQRLLP